MSPARKPKEPRALIQVLSWNGDHEVILRVSKRTRFFLMACLMALIFSGTGTTLGAVVETVRMLMEAGVVP